MRRIIEMMGVAAGPFKPQWARSVRITVLGALCNGVALVLLLPLVTALLSGDHRTGWWLLLGLAALLVTESILRLGELGFAYNLYPDVMADLRLRLGQHLRRVPAEELARRRSGELSAVLNQDVTSGLLAVSDVASMFLRLIVIPIGFVISLIVIDWRLLLGALVGAAIAALALARQNATMLRTQREVGSADAETADRLVEYVQGLPVLKAAGQVGERSERLVAAMHNQGRVLRSSIDETTFSLTGAAIGANLAVAGVVAVGAALVLGAQLSPLTAAAIVVAAAGLAEPLARAASLTAVFEASEAAMERVNAVLEIAPLPEPREPKALERHDVILDHVTFTYHGAAAPALRGVDMTLRSGTLTAFVGPSGGGKTTVTRMITRFADPQEGSVRIGGIDIRDVTERDLMRSIAAVFQDVYLFDTTIYENVAMARPGAGHDEVLAALEAANCGDLLARLPQRAQTRVGEIGSQLSGGERQRVAIARALLKDAPIVVLDEPTSALDTESEVMVQEAIDRLVADKTVAVIAHRLSTIVAADQIIVLDGGGIVEKGDHESLLAADGRYAAMWAAQTRARGWTVTG
ncbi:ABC transporter ATP-binding protein [Propionicicella superfundia]|uniref:ABC transporter ATP-binding protein n=1 Tax=Propionicicella superfundia TaxID=348582 RepID=UPI0004090493|nr:ABC transporter ATP-binding protein [Propionicicella superfundia]